MDTTTQGRVGDQLVTLPQRHYSFKDPGLAVDPPILSTHGDDVAEVEPLDGFRLNVKFFDGISGIVEMRELIFSDKAGVFAVLRDEAEFAKVGIGMGAVMWVNEAWPTELDLAPDAMHDELKRSGVWVLR